MYKRIFSIGEYDYAEIRDNAYFFFAAGNVAVELEGFCFKAEAFVVFF